MINWQLSKQGIRWPVSPDRTAGSSEYFWSYPLTNFQFQMIAGSSLFFPMIRMKYVVFMSLCPRTVKILISNWPRTRKFRQFFENRDLKHQDGRGGRRLTGSEKSHFDSSAHANRLHHPVLPSSSTWSEEFWRRAQNVSKFWLFLSWNVTVGSKYLM